jgi:hypothetical protein
LFWSLSLITISLMPIDRQAAGTEPAKGTKSLPVWMKPMRHRLAHFAVFAITGALFLTLAQRPDKSRQSWPRATLAVISALLVALLIEITQVQMYGLRDLEWWDVRDDAIGIAMGLCVWLFWRWSRWKGEAV